MNRLRCNGTKIMEYNGHTITCVACAERIDDRPVALAGLKRLARDASVEAMTVMPGTLTQRQLFGLVGYLRARLRFEMGRNSEGKR